ncbi:MAG: tRNA pseudouridine(38-40) synthase TruA [Clostridiales bacterium]|jgi:tRNA pseudouridine38-40 synthase|nr:tRNA pseudouridine(38-40) synthase TruA [Clostridiales bacterium]
MKTRFFIIIEYDGKNYCGWQRQKNGMTVQEMLEDKLSVLFGSKITVFGSSRTDAGVSAFCQTAHFDAETDIPPKKIPFAVNSLLPNDISVRSCRAVPVSFHARFCDKKKTYTYKLYVSDIRRPLLDRERFFVKRALNVQAMTEAASYMTGTYDCKCFQKSGSVSGGTVRTVYSVTVCALADGCLDIGITGSGFLYKMARTMAGTLLSVGLGALSPSDVACAVKNCDKTKTGKTLPPEFLYINDTEYTEPI